MLMIREAMVYVWAATFLLLVLLGAWRPAL